MPGETLTAVVGRLIDCARAGCQLAARGFELAGGERSLLPFPFRDCVKAIAGPERQRPPG
jgi:hypothetical protein